MQLLVAQMGNDLGDRERGQEMQIGREAEEKGVRKETWEAENKSNNKEVSTARKQG